MLRSQRANRPGALINWIYDRLIRTSSRARENPTGNESVATLAFLLQRVSEPYLRLLQQWIGLADASTLDADLIPFAQPWNDLGIERSAGSDVGWEYRFDPSRTPDFFSDQQKTLLFEAGRSLRTLRAASDGRHPLCSTEWYLPLSWTSDGESQDINSIILRHERRVYREVEAWRKIESSSISTPELEEHRGDATSTSRGESIPASHETRNFAHLFFDAVQSQDVTVADARSPQTISNFLKGYPTIITSARDVEHSHKRRAMRIASPLCSHGRLVSRALLSLYIDDLHLLDHFDILRAYFSAGDPAFLERVSKAVLGDVEVDPTRSVGMGRRARTRARMGLRDVNETSGPSEQPISVGLGIGLSDRSRWPPGGAEMTYALRTAIVDDELKSGPVWRSIEDMVSFAIQDLPVEDSNPRRKTWLDPQCEYPSQAEEKLMIQLSSET